MNKSKNKNARPRQRPGVAIYARVSTDKQQTDMQLHELRQYVKRSSWKIYNEYIDHGYTGANTKRPAFTSMMSDAKKKKFSVLLVWKLDRLGRSLRDLITTLDELGALGIDFISYENQLDTSTPTGKLTFQIIGAVAEFEKDIIRERVRAGLANARRKGKTLGRPKKPPIFQNQARISKDEHSRRKGSANKKPLNQDIEKNLARLVENICS